MSIRNRILATVGATALLVSTALSGVAATSDNATVSITENSGAFSVSIVGASFGSHQYSFQDRTVSGTLTAGVIDNRGTAPGWRVNLTASDFTAGTKSFDISNLSLTPGAPAVPAGQYGHIGSQTVASAFTVQETGGSTSNQVWSAAAGSGDGNFELPLTGSLKIPGGTLVGDYTSVVTVSIVSGP